MIAEAKPARRRGKDHRKRGKSRTRRKWSVLWRDSFRCTYCGKDLLASIDDLLMSGCDHFEPVARGGTSDRENVVACCAACNQLKANTRVADIEAARVLVAKRREMFRAQFERHLTRIEGHGLPVRRSQSWFGRLAGWLRPRRAGAA